MLGTTRVENHVPLGEKLAGDNHRHETAVDVSIVLDGIDTPSQRIIENKKRGIEAMYKSFIEKMADGIMNNLGDLRGRSIDVIIDAIVNTFSESASVHARGIPEPHERILAGFIALREQDLRDYLFSLYNSIYQVKDIKEYN